MGRRIHYEVHHAGNILHIKSNYPFIVKTKGVKGIVNHSLMISDKSHLDNENGIEKQIFRQNDYHVRLIKRIIVKQYNLSHNYGFKVV